MSKVKHSIKSNASFVSYLDKNGKVTDLKKSNSKFYGSELDCDKHLEPDLLPGEAVISTAYDVLRFTSFHHDSSQASGVVGVLYVTNFRIAFCIATGNNEEYQQRNKLIREDDIVLNCIDTVYQVSKGKKKKLLPTTSSSGTGKVIQIHCKDFQLHSFSLKMCKKEDTVKTMNALLHHCFPMKLNLLFAFDYQVETSDGDGPETPRFTQASDWQRELDRLKVTGFKVLDCNTDFQNCENLPEVMIVPESLDLPELKKYANQFVDYRWPVWSYSYKNGASLVRMACIIPKSIDSEIEGRIYDKIRLTHPNKKDPKVVDFTELQQCQELPSLKEIQTCYEKLRELCMPSKRKDLSKDSTWYSDLEASGWLLVVHKCLSQALDCVIEMADRKKTVIFKENNSRDLTPLLTCLVQLMLDPYCRTLQGFQALVEKEWVALGHDFTERLGLLRTSEQCPLFVLFLDCVWQISLQFPSAFQFSDVYLITLWDTVCLGLFDNFIFDCVRNRKNVPKGFKQYRSANIQFMSAWDWSRQFDTEYLALLHNPLYVTRTELKLNIPNHHRGLSSGEEVQLERVYSRKLAEIYEPIPEQDIQLLKPVVRAPLLKFWSHCYLRWVTPLEIRGGGGPAEYLQQCMLVEEILCLKHQIHSLETHTAYVRSARPRSDLVFSFDVSKAKNNEGIMSARWSEKMALTSSFPYRSSSANTQLLPMETSLNLFLENSFIQDSDDDFDSESVDGLECTNNDTV